MPSTLDKPFEIPTKAKNKYAEKELVIENKTSIESKRGRFINEISFLLVNLSIKNPEKKRVIIEVME